MQYNRQQYRNGGFYEFMQQAQAHNQGGDPIYGPGGSKSPDDDVDNCGKQMIEQVGKLFGSYNFSVMSTRNSIPVTPISPWRPLKCWLRNLV